MEGTHQERPRRGDRRTELRGLLRRLIRVATCALLLPACFPGRCEGAFRWLATPGENVDGDRSTIALIRPDATFALNADFAAAEPDELLARSKIDDRTFFVTGANGHVPAVIHAHSFPEAHTCASAASFVLRPTNPLPRGDYAVVLLLDEVAWPAVFDGDVTRWQGKRALVRRFHVD